MGGCCSGDSGPRARAGVRRERGRAGIGKAYILVKQEFGDDGRARE